MEDLGLLEVLALGEIAFLNLTSHTKYKIWTVCNEGIAAQIAIISRWQRLEG